MSARGGGVVLAIGMNQRSCKCLLEVKSLKSSIRKGKRLYAEVVKIYGNFYYSISF